MFENHSINERFVAFARADKIQVCCSNDHIPFNIWFGRTCPLFNLYNWSHTSRGPPENYEKFQLVSLVRAKLTNIAARRSRKP